MQFMLVFIKFSLKTKHLTVYLPHDKQLITEELFKNGNNRK